MYSFSYLEPVCCFMSSSNCGFLTYIQPWCTPFPIWNQSVVSCPVLTAVSWPVYRFFRRQVRCFGIPISVKTFQFVVIHTVKGFGTVNKEEVRCFSGTVLLFWWSSRCWQFVLWLLYAFSKTCLKIWKFTVHILLEPGLEILNITLLSCEMSVVVQ